MTHETVLDSATAPARLDWLGRRARATRLAAVAEPQPGPRSGAAGRAVRRRGQGAFTGATSGAVRRPAGSDPEPESSPAAGIGHGRDAAGAGPDVPLCEAVAGGQAAISRRADQPPGGDAAADATAGGQRQPPARCPRDGVWPGRSGQSPAAVGRGEGEAAQADARPDDAGVPGEHGPVPPRPGGPAATARPAGDAAWLRPRAAGVRIARMPDGCL